MSRVFRRFSYKPGWTLAQCLNRSHEVSSVRAISARLHSSRSTGWARALYTDCSRMTLEESWIGNWDINHLKSKLPNPNSWHWEHTPSWSDPRLPVLGILALYIVLGITVLGFNRSPVQILICASSFGVAVLTY